MKIERLPHGQPAPVEADCLAIDTLAGGRVNLTGTLLEGDESLALTGMTFDNRAQAEEQGLAWAQSHGVELIYITTDAPMAGS